MPANLAARLPARNGYGGTLKFAPGDPARLQKM
jgi:hypothetical protein